MKSRTLSSFLVGTIWLGMIPLFLLAAWLAWDSLQEREAELLREGERSAHNYAMAVDQFLNARMSALNLLASSPLADDPRRWSELYVEAQGFEAVYQSHVIFADLERQMRFNTRVAFGTPLPALPLSKGRSAAPLALQTGEPQVGDIVSGPVANQQLVAIVVPGLRGGKVAHLVLTTVELAQFQQRIEGVALPAEWSLALEDGTGVTIARRAPAGMAGTPDPESGHRFKVALTLAPWSVVLDIPRSAYIGGWIRSAAWLGAAIALATLLGVLGGRLASRRLEKQVVALTSPAQDVAHPPDIAEIAAAKRQLDSALAWGELSEARFRRLFERAPVALGLAGQDGLILARNDRFEQLFGYSTVDLPTVDQWWLLAYPDPIYRAEVMTRWNAALESASHGAGDFEAGVFPVACKDGGTRMVEISGMLIGDTVLVAFVDVTASLQSEQTLAAARLAAINQMEDANAARVAAERALASLHESQERLQLLIDHAPAALAMFDREMRYLAVSQRWRDDYGLGEREIVGQSHYEIFPEIPQRWRTVHHRGLDGELISADEDRFERADGTEQWLRWEVRPWHAVDGRVGGIVIFSEDITHLIAARHQIMELNASLERRVVERTAELSAANQELEAFAYAVSHDLRAPLRALSGFSQALVEDYGPQLQGEAKTYLDQIVLAARKMGDLIDGILTLSRSTRGELQREVIDLSALAAGQLAALAREEPQRQVAVAVDPGLTATGDRRMIESVLANLLGNAWKYTGKTAAAEIRVHVEERDGMRWYCVTDNGAGFDVAHAARLFKPFQRLHRQDEFPGLGIGLATVQRIIHRHGGDIAAHAEPGKGATFAFTLPEVTPAAESANEETS